MARSTKRRSLVAGRNGRTPPMVREPYTFYLEPGLVERVRREVEEPDVVRSIEAALVSALDYQLWVREVRRGRDPLG